MEAAGEAVAAADAVESVGPGSGPVYGTAVHSAFSDTVLGLEDGNPSSEISYLNEDVVPYGTAGSVRLDVVEGPLTSPTAVYDLKTGSAMLSSSRISKIQSNIPGGSNVPAHVVRP